MAAPATKILNRLWRTATLLLVLFLLSSCSSIQFAYNQLDLWMRWQIDDYVDFNSVQKGQLQGALDSFHRWHRQTQLPRYAEYLAQLADQVDQGHLEQVELAAVEGQVSAFWDAASTQLYDVLLPLAPQLSDEQIDGLEENLREKREESLEKWQKSPDKIERRRKKQIRKQSERWLGSLSDEQEQLIADWVAQVAYNPLLRDQQRKIWQANFIDLLRRKPDGYLNKMRDLLLNPEQLWSEDYRQMQEQRHQQARELSREILASTTETQRRHLTRTLREYAADFRTLASQ
ncbi:hypothetical protein SAMN04487965_1183 [Microbulbifer donghaiensis]|uniref:Lipoprotein n=1 Tax=Microbulbifer donghaiensis TaxID=494016 RepID=A0A1M4Y856_9GAMM|nr:DUF6279 family lipoprotein [Microbulbifer donghaiensis]SHF01951.1 hypothetical protein SAMN04487965_1183 [Microbulbifer donghaiensis]